MALRPMRLQQWSLLGTLDPTVSRANQALPSELENNHADNLLSQVSGGPGWGGGVFELRPEEEPETASGVG